MTALLHHLFTQEAEFQPSADAQRDGLRAILATPSAGRPLVADAGGTLLGMVNILFTISTALGGRVAILEDVIVLPEARGLGLGRRRITLHTDHDNRQAQRFYERAGFARSDMVMYRMILSR